MANGTGKMSTRKKINPFWLYSTSRIVFLLAVLGVLSFALSRYVSWGASVALKNCLADSTSPYLREAGNSPVHWQPWGEEAFEFAKTFDRPVLIDVGAIWCHWCHVMDEQTYGNPEIAKFINEHFIPIKVDSDARRTSMIAYSLSFALWWDMEVGL
jgi:thiol:disulfide interchange protein